MAGKLGRAVKAMTAVILTGALVSACGQAGGRTQLSDGDTVDYVLRTELSTTNAGSKLGTSDHAATVAARLYPGTYIFGTNGQKLPNADLVRTQTIPGVQRKVEYTIDADANYSDGQPIVCDDFLLAHVAGINPDLFGSDLPLMSQVDTIDCDTGSKQFTVVYQQHRGERWRSLFGPGEVLPSHVIAQRAGMSQEDLVDALKARDTSRLEDVAAIWRDGFNLDHFDPELQVSAGPYRIDRIGDKGEAVLVRNESYHGAQARLGEVRVWSARSDITSLEEDRELGVVELDGQDKSWIRRNDPQTPYEVITEPGRLVDSLELSTTGVFATPEARRAFAACIDNRAVAQASSDESGVEVTPTGVHVVTPSDPRVRRLADISDAHMAVNAEEAAQLRDNTVRIGYRDGGARKAAMVEAIKSSCAPLGIDIVDAGAEGGDLRNLGQDGGIDAYLRSVEPNRQFGDIETSKNPTTALREAEDRAWESAQIIPLSQEPRIFVVNHYLDGVVPYTGLTGAGWNIDRWQVRKATDG